MPNELSDFDFQLLSMHVGSMTVREIAFAMDVESGEIDSAFMKIAKHFGVKDIDEASKKAIEAGIISLDL